MIAQTLFRLQLTTEMSKKILFLCSLFSATNSVLINYLLELILQNTTTSTKSNLTNLALSILQSQFLPSSLAQVDLSPESPEIFLLLDL